MLYRYFLIKVEVIKMLPGLFFLLKSSLSSVCHHRPWNNPHSPVFIELLFEYQTSMCSSRCAAHAGLISTRAHHIIFLGLWLLVIRPSLRQLLMSIRLMSHWTLEAACCNCGDRWTDETGLDRWTYLMELSIRLHCKKKKKKDDYLLINFNSLALQAPCTFINISVNVPV